MTMTTVAGLTTGGLALALLGLAALVSCVLDLRTQLRDRDAQLLTAQRKANRDKATAAMLRRSNETLRRHTADHCRREAAIRALLAAHGISLVDSPAVSVADLDAAQSPADIDWGQS